ncbi:MAG: HNH endonuclease [Prevotellaceae bacterium]|nr:HNH endonuclease [Prevotellaceae bacterium]
MGDFRKITPSRRMGVAVQSKYKSYKADLRIDFHQRCGYCGDHDFFSESYYEIDHFVPKSLDPSKELVYSNLVYSCRSCNNSKRAKWPTNDPNKPNNGTIGWIDPCDVDYPNQFERLADGSIRATTPLGNWMWSAMSMGKPNHRLKYLLEQLRIELKKTDNLAIDDSNELKAIKELNARYRQFEESLRGYPNFY